MGVYQHGGVTSHLRAEFLNQEGNNILLEDKSKMFAFPYGTSLAFNGMLVKVAPAVKVRHDEITANRQLATTIRVADSLSKQDRPQQSYNKGHYNLRDSKGPGSNRGKWFSSNFSYKPYNKSHKKSFPGKRGQGSGDPQSNYSGHNYKQQQQQNSQQHNQGSANNSRSKSN